MGFVQHTCWTAPFLFVSEVLWFSIVALRFFSYLWYDYTLTNMNCKTITERLKRVAAIVDSWKAENGIPQIERDIALGEIRDIYNALLVVEVEDVDDKEEAEETELSEQEVEVEFVIESPVEEEVAAEEDVVEETADAEEEPTTTKKSSLEDVASIESFYNALDIDALLGLNDEPAASNEEVAEPEPGVEEKAEESAVVEKVAEPVVESVVESVVEPVAEVVAEPIVEPVAEPKKEEAKPVGTGLFDLNDIPVRTKSRRKMISLYSDNPVPVQTPAEEVKLETVEEVVKEKAESVVESAPMESVAEAEVVAPVAESTISATQRLGDSFGGVKTLADQMAKDDTPTMPFNRITELRQAIGLNDKFLMIRDLFGGDAVRYEATIDTLDEFDDLDECIIYIVENFRWNPDLEATKLLVSLIERKLA